MPPRTTSATRPQLAKTNNSQAIRKVKTPVSSQRNTRSRAVRSTKTLATNPTPPFATSPPLTDPPQTRGERRRRAFQEDRPAKRLQSNPQFAFESGQPLSESNLATLEWLTGSNLFDKMDPTIATPEKSGRKRSSSRQSSTTDISYDTTSSRSQKSSGTYAHYRWVTLNKARIFIRNRPPPENIQARINAVIQRETSEERKHDLAVIAKGLSLGFAVVMDGASSEDDSVGVVHRALFSMDKDGKLALPRKIDWDPNLKPKIPQLSWHINIPEKSNDNANDLVDLPSKRRQVNISVNSPDRSQFAMPLPPPPPPPPLPPDNSVVKTPRPNITVGLRHSTMVERLVVQGVDEVKADAFLRFLQEQQALCSDPAQQPMPIRFPLMVVEGKLYSTGRFIFEAQNQAAVSGSCMMNMLDQLAKLHDSVVPGPHDNIEPLAFSICTEGPYMELWVHYTTSEGGVRKYNMNMLQICNALILEGVVDFLVVVDKVLSWASSDFVDNIAKQLASVERATRYQAT